MNVSITSDCPGVDVISVSTSKLNESNTVFIRPSQEQEEDKNHVYSLLRQHSDTFPIVGSILSATALMEHRLSEMETMLCNMETRWTLSRAKVNGLEIGGDTGSFMQPEKDTNGPGCLGDSREGDFRYPPSIKDNKVDCQFEGTNLEATLYDNTCKIPSPSVMSQISWTLLEAESTMKEAVMILQSVLDNLETLCDYSTENRAVDINAIKGDESDLVMLEFPLVVDSHVNTGSKKIAREMKDGDFESLDESEVQNARLKTAYEHQVIRQIQQDTLFLQKHDHNEKLVIACTAALKVASNLEEIIHGFESCSFDRDDDNTESMQIQINNLQEQQQILTEQLCTLQFEHVECQEKLHRIQAENLGLNEELKRTEECFNLFQINVTVDLERVTFAFEHHISEIDVQLCKQTERIHEKLQQNEILLVSKVKQLQEQGKEFHDLSAQSQNAAVMLMKMKRDLDQIQTSFAAAVDQYGLQALSLQTAIADAKAGEEKLGFLQSKLEVSERNASLAVQGIAKDSKKLQLRHENILAIVLLCVSVLVHCMTQLWIQD